MSYKEFQRRHWNSLASEFGKISPLRAVISRDSDLSNYYYDRESKKFLRRAVRFENRNILDFGCGVGRLSIWLASQATRVTGVDISEEMVRVARAATRSRRLVNVNFLVYDGTRLPFEDNVFDVIVCAGILKYVADDEDFSALVAEMCRTVRPGGQVVVIDEFDYLGPTELRRGEDIGGQSVLRSPNAYISTFGRHAAVLQKQWVMLRKLVRVLGVAIVMRIPFGKYIAASKVFAHVVAGADVYLDELLRYHQKPVCGFQLLMFERA